MRAPHIVIDTNVWVAAFRSKRGASWSLIREIGRGAFKMHVSTPLVLEYEAVFHRQRERMNLSQAEVEQLVDLICELGIQQREVFYLWRPFVADPDDAHVLELAVVAQADFLVTFNKRDFPHAGAFGIRLATPYEFLTDIGLLS